MAPCQAAARNETWLLKIYHEFGDLTAVFARPIIRLKRTAGRLPVDAGTLPGLRAERRQSAAHHLGHAGHAGYRAALPEAGVLLAFATLFFAVGVWRLRYE